MSLWENMQKNRGNDGFSHQLWGPLEFALELRGGHAKADSPDRGFSGFTVQTALEGFGPSCLQ